MSRATQGAKESQCECVLFVYGTLRCCNCLEDLLGRVPERVPDRLDGYRRSKITLGKARYPNIVADPLEHVEGFRVYVTTRELRVLDAYETAAYERREVELQSGQRAWVYRGV